MDCILFYFFFWLQCYTGKLCHRGKCHSGNCHNGERWMSRPFVHSGNLNFKHFDKWFGLPQCLKMYHLSLYNINKDMLLTGPFAMLSIPSFDFHLPPCTEGFLIHLSPLWQMPLWQLPLFPSVAQFPCVHQVTSWDTQALHNRAVSLSHSITTTSPRPGLTNCFTKLSLLVLLKIRSY